MSSEIPEKRSNGLGGERDYWLLGGVLFGAITWLLYALGILAPVWAGIAGTAKVPPNADDLREALEALSRGIRFPLQQRPPVRLRARRTRHEGCRRQASDLSRDWFRGVTAGAACPATSSKQF